MRFRVTSIAWSESSDSLSSVTVKIEDLLNALLADGEFGGNLGQFVIVVVAFDDDPAENNKWAKPRNKLGLSGISEDGEKYAELSIAVQLRPSEIAASSPDLILPLLVEAIIFRLHERPKRLPKGFDYGKFAKAVELSLCAFQ